MRIISVMLALVVALLFVLTYVFVNSLAIRNKQRESEMQMDQAEYNINFAIASIRDYLQYAYNSEDVYNVILSSHEDMAKITSSINQIYNDFTIFLPRLHSLQFYNENTREFYSRSVVPMTDNGNQKKEIANIKLMYKSNVVMRSVEMYDGTRDDVISYIFIDYNSYSDNSSYIVVNIYTSWLEDIVKSNNINGEENFIVQFGRTGDFQSDKNNLLTEFFLKYSPGDEYNVVKAKLGGKKYLVASKKIDAIDGRIIKMYPYKEIYKPIILIRLIILLLALLTEAMVLFIGIKVSKRIYSPIDDLYKYICKKPRKSQNEIEQIRNVFKIIESRNEFSHEQSLRTRCIERLLSSENTLGLTEIKRILDGIGISEEPELLMVCAFEISDYDNFSLQNKSSDVKSILYGIYNIANELISEKFVCCGMITDKGLIKFIAEPKEKEENLQENLKCICTTVSDNMKNYFNLYVNSCIGNEITDITKINSEMFKTVQSIIYAYNYEPGCCITPDMVKKNISNIHGISKLCIEQLRHAISSCDIKKVGEKIRCVFDEIKELEYFTEQSEVTMLVKMIEDELENLSGKATEVLPWRLILRQKYIDDVEKMLLSDITDTINESIKVKDNMMNKKNTEMVHEAERIIREEYSNSNLCMSYISEKLSVGYRLLGKMFSEEYGVSVAQYINKVRLEKSIELLRESNMSVLQISVACGYESEAYFYRVFKKMFGMTPKQYSSMLK